MRRERLIARYEEKNKHDLMIIGMVRDLPLKENIIKFKIEFLKYDKKDYNQSPRRVAPAYRRSNKNKTLRRSFKRN